MDTAQLLEVALRAAGVPILGVQLVDLTDRSTWSVRFAPGATSDQKSLATTIIQRFDVNDQSMKDTAQAADAARTVQDPVMRASCRFLIYALAEAHETGRLFGATLVWPGMAVDRAMTDAATNLFARCVKEVAETKP